MEHKVFVFRVLFYPPMTPPECFQLPNAKMNICLKLFRTRLFLSFLFLCPHKNFLIFQACSYFSAWKNCAPFAQGLHGLLISPE